MSLPTESARLAARERPTHSRLVMYQRWEALLFLHWAYDPSTIQRTLPPGLTVDTFEDSAYLGIVPFYMRNVRPRYFPRVPGISDFLELNLRTYVYDRFGIPGIWFYSLDANQWLAVQSARILFQLPYFYARMHTEKDQQTGEISYTSHRFGTSKNLASKFRYRPCGSSDSAEPGTLEFFLIERYVLFAYRKEHKTLLSGRVHHRPYQLMTADVPEWSDSVFVLDNFERPCHRPEHILMSPGVDVEIFAIESIR